MNPRPIPLLLIAVIISVLYSCQRELSDPLPAVPPPAEVPDTVSTDPTPKPPAIVDNIIVTNVQGRILDETGKPMFGVTVIAGGKTTSTDEFGIFTLNEVLVSEHSSFIKAEAPGYFTGSRTIVSEANGNGFVQIKMIRKKVIGSFDASSGGEITTEGNATIKFSQASITTSSGEAYEGTVKVYSAFLNPDAANFNDIMPGDLRGLNADSQSVALKSYGMLNVKLETEAGQELQIASGKNAEIRMKVPASLAATAPADIPLWHFSEYDGKWREEGKATLQNGWYVGSVSHFSTWNCDVPANFVFVTLMVRGEKGTRRSYTRVKFIDETNGLYSEGFTDSEGKIKAWIPKDASLKMKIVTDCDEVLYEQQVGPFSQDTDLGAVTVDGKQLMHIFGTVIGCDGESITTGYAVMRVHGLDYTSEIINGEFNFYTSKCIAGTTDADIMITDPYKSHYTTPTTIQIGTQNVNVGSVQACEVSSLEYVAYALGQDTVLIESAYSTIDYNAFIGDTATRVTFHWGIYDVGFSDVTVEFYDTVAGRSTVMNPLTMLDHGDTLEAIAPLIVDVKKIGAVGSMIHLTFTGMYRNIRTNEDRPLSGEMWVKRRK
jgi:hypothetical protein